MKNFRTLLSTLLSTVGSTGKRKIGDLTEENSLRAVEIQVLMYTLLSKMVCEIYDRRRQTSGYSRFLICAGVGGDFGQMRWLPGPVGTIFLLFYLGVLFFMGVLRYFCEVITNLIP